MAMTPTQEHQTLDRLRKEIISAALVIGVLLLSAMLAHWLLL
jgi:hypothetical protein